MCAADVVNVEKIVILIYLMWNSWIDYKKKEICIISVVIFSIYVILDRIFMKGFQIEILYGIVPGIFFIISSVLTRGRIGMGDGILLLSLGLLMQIEAMVLLIFMALMTASVYSGIFIILKHKNKNTEIPFVPFILLGYIFGEILCGKV